MPPVQSAGLVVPPLATLARLLGLALLALAGARIVPPRAPAKAADSAAFDTRRTWSGAVASATVTASCATHSSSPAT
eukprot:scaffold121926_cov48-Phaeocystis_antarctica.AAC.1